MNCRDFKEILDSYLSGELLVETNHEVIRHLENCRDCRELLAERRELRSRLRRAVTQAAESQIDPAFAVRVRESLRSSREVRAPFAMGRSLAAAAAVVIVGILAVFVLLRDQPDTASAEDLLARLPQTPAAAPPPSGAQVVPALLLEVSSDAFDDHKNCALSHNLKEKPISLEKAARTVDAASLGFEKMVHAAMRDKFGPDVELLKAHYCLINGRHFTHVVLSFRGRVLSVLLTKLSDTPAAPPASCGTDGELGAACFSSGGYGIYVVSETKGSDNLLIADGISEAVDTHISNLRLSI